MPKPAPKAADLERLDPAVLIKMLLEAHAEIARLKERLEKLEREKHRSAAPFSRNQPKQNPGTPGRKPGIGTFKYKSKPNPEQITQTVQVMLEQNICQSCGNLLEPAGFRFAWISELPEVKPEIIEYQLERKTCPACGITVQARHPMVSQNQVGSTAHRLGPRALALAHSLQYEMGVTVRKVPAVLALTVGLRVTQGALTQSALKLADENGVMDVQYQALRENIKSASLVNTDDTGWRVTGSNAFLMAFKTNSSVVYQIREQHRSNEVLEVIPANFAGVMGSDQGGDAFNAQVRSGGATCGDAFVVREQKDVQRRADVRAEDEGDSGLDRHCPARDEGECEPESAVAIWRISGSSRTGLRASTRISRPK